jgi:mono/diheme cytochrome c family protein
MSKITGCSARGQWNRALIALALATAALSSPSAAEDDMGKPLYLRYCSACHGPGGKGDGIVSQLMTPKPIDLTLLAKQAGGKYPFYDVIRRIDGRETVRAHGDSDMPVWGEVFEAEENAAPGAQAVARGKAVLIADYLGTIQQK